MTDKSSKSEKQPLLIEDKSKKDKLEDSKKSPNPQRSPPRGGGPPGYTRHLIRRNDRSHEFDQGPFGLVKTLVYLAVFWVIVFGFAYSIVFLQSLRIGNIPVYFGEHTFIGGKPSITFEPNLERLMPGTQNKKGIFYSTNNPSSFYPLMQRYADVVKEYQDSVEMAKENATCEPQMDGKWTDKRCDVDRTNYGHQCIPSKRHVQSSMGFNTGNPCIMLRLTRILGFYPVIPNVTDHENREKNRKNLCKKERFTIKCTPDKYSKEIGIKYYPPDGIGTCNFPFWNQNGYETPFIMMQLNLTAVPDKTEVKFTCNSSARDVVSLEFFVSANK